MFSFRLIAIFALVAVAVALPKLKLVKHNKQRVIVDTSEDSMLMSVCVGRHTEKHCIGHVLDQWVNIQECIALVGRYYCTGSYWYYTPSVVARKA